MNLSRAGAEKVYLGESRLEWHACSPHRRGGEKKKVRALSTSATTSKDQEWKSTISFSR